VAAGSLQPPEYLSVAEYRESRTVTNTDPSGSFTIFVADQKDSLTISFVAIKQNIFIP
jgi:flavin reductase (DIM6/NTAB) family NADH-FMN oxidoreductase RutF